MAKHKDNPQLNIRIGEDARARLYSLSSLTGTPVYKLVIQALEQQWHRLSPDLRRKAEMIAELRGSEDLPL